MSEFKRFNTLNSLLTANGPMPKNKLKQLYLTSDIEHLLSTRIIKEHVERNSFKISVVNKEKLQRYIQAQFKHGQPVERPNHKEAALHYKDAHKSTRREVSSVSVRTLNKEYLITKSGVSVNLGEACSAGLAFTLPIYKLEANWSLSGTVCTVENLECFWKAEQVIKADLYIYLPGKFSNEILDWLASEKLDNCHFIHWGDYDPVGVQSYCRIRNTCGSERTQYYIPDNIEDLIRGGNPQRIQEQKIEFSKTDLTCPSVQIMVDLFRRYGKGRDQEVSL